MMILLVSIASVIPFCFLAYVIFYTNHVVIVIPSSTKKIVAGLSALEWVDSNTK